MYKLVYGTETNSSAFVDSTLFHTQQSTQMNTSDVPCKSHRVWPINKSVQAVRW